MQLHQHTLTQAQQMLWLGQQLHPESALYSSPFSFRFRWTLDDDRFGRVFEQVVAESDAMRIVFHTEAGEAHQTAKANIGVAMSKLDWSAEENVESKLSDWLAERVQLALNIEEQCYDSVLIKLAEDDWVWYFNTHHLVMDAWGVGVVYRRVAELYAQREGQEAAMPRFADFVLAHTAEPKQENPFWAAYREALPEPASLYNRSAVLGADQSRRVRLDVSKDIRAGLEAWCQTPRFRHFTPDLTRFNCMATLVLAFLHKTSGQQKVALGTPAHNRPNAKLRNTPGQFIEVLPLMAELEPGETFASLHDKVRANYNGFLKNAKASTANPELLRPVRFVLNYINAKFPAFDDKPVEVKWIHPGCHDSAHQLRLQVYDYSVDGQLQFDLDINEAAFPDEWGEQIPEQFLHLFEQMLAKPDMPIAEAALLPKNQLQNHLESSAGEKIDFEAHDFLALFGQQVEHQAEHRAISFGEHSMSYLELDEAANQLSHFLISRGLRVGDTVAIHHKRHPRLVIAILAVLKAGGTYVPLAADLPAERLQLILQKSQAKILLTEKSLFEKLSELEQTCVLLDQDASMIDQHENGSPGRSVDPSAPAYLLYTSGSTGEPKGVMISRASLANYVQWAGKTYMQGRSAVFPLFTAIGFDLTVTSIFVPLAFGGQIRVYEEKMREGPDLAILEVLAEDRVDIIKLTPSHLSLIQHKHPAALNLASDGVHPISALEGQMVQTRTLEDDTDRSSNLEDQAQEDKRLRDALHPRKSKRAYCLIVGGENFATDLAKRALDYFGPNTRIYNEYGPTEATVGCIVHLFDTIRDQQASVPIGRPIANMEALILNEYGQMQPQGVAGELYLSGKGLASGYWQNDQQTNDRFLPHAFTDGQLMYKTGDLALWNADGMMEFLGRVDRQVKFRGFRLELNEVEASVAQHPAVSEVAVELL
ncbi:MAG: AMP-binding protein, partial [Bacteroidota bacterium]